MRQASAMYMCKPSGHACGLSAHAAEAEGVRGEGPRPLVTTLAKHQQHGAIVIRLQVDLFPQHGQQFFTELA